MCLVFSTVQGERSILREDGLRYYFPFHAGEGV